MFTNRIKITWNDVTRVAQAEPMLFPSTRKANPPFLHSLLESRVMSSSIEDLRALGLRYSVTVAQKLLNGRG